MVKMTQREARVVFTLNIAWLLLYMEDIGLQPAGDFWKRCLECPVGKDNSNHKKGLAIDIHLYDKDGKWLDETMDHADTGGFWESLHPWNRWGGRWSDGNHYEFIIGGWR